MKKLVYTKSWRETEKPNVICVHKSNKEEITTLFEKYKYRVDIVDFNDDCSIAIMLNDFRISKTEFAYEVLNLLLNNGYEFTETVKSRFEWYKSKIEEEVTKQQEVKETVKQQVNTILWCWENGCETTFKACSKCRFTNGGINCEPKTAVIEERNGKQYVRILKNK